MQSRRSRYFRRAAMVGAALGLLGACAPEPAYVPREAAFYSVFPQIEDEEIDKDEIRTCNMLQRAYDLGGWPKGDDIETVRRIDEMVRARFLYSREGVDEFNRKIDKWNSQADTVVRTDHMIAGDCDDLAITVVALARCAGVPEDRLGLALARVNGSRRINHMVGFYTDWNGRSFSLGDTFSRPRPMLAPGQDFAYWAFLDDLQTWLRRDAIANLRDPRLAVIEANRSEPK